jgi:hypothetical protein
MKFLPVAVHAPRQRPAVQGHDRLVVRTASRSERRLHPVRSGGRRFWNRSGPSAAADRACAGENSGGFAESSSREHVRSPFLVFVVNRLFHSFWPAMAASIQCRCEMTDFNMWTWNSRVFPGEMVQMGMGMIGMFIVHPRDESFRRVDRDFVFMMSSYAIDPGTALPRVSGLATRCGCAWPISP